MSGATRSGGRRTGFGALLRGHRYMNLTTFRRSGEGVKTPVWFAEGAGGGELYVYTMGDSGKAKRVRNGSGALVGPSDRRGGALGPEEPAVARILAAAEEAAEAALNRKYGLRKRAFGLVVRALGKAEGRVYLGIVPAPDGAARTTGAPTDAGEEAANLFVEEGARSTEAKETRGSAAGRVGTGRGAVWSGRVGADAPFAAAATLALAAIGALEGAGALPWVVPGGESAFIGFYDSLPAWAQVAFGTWQAAGTLLGLVLPAAAVAAWDRRGEGGRAVRGALAPYALVLLWQVLVEAAFARAFFPNIVVLTGMIYTAYRIRQLLRSRRAFAASPATGKLPARARRSVGVLLTAGTVFWSANLAFLLTVMVPRVTEF